MSLACSGLWGRVRSGVEQSERRREGFRPGGNMLCLEFDGVGRGFGVVRLASISSWRIYEESRDCSLAEASACRRLFGVGAMFF